jgi:CheY-like chemotaxis protein
MIRPRDVPAEEPRTILVVEDEVLIRLAICEDLRDAGFRVLEVATAEQALSYLDLNRDIDLVFSDVRMPGPMDGLALWKTVRERYPAIKVVLTSGHWSWRPIEGEPILIRKPYDAATVIARIHTVLAWDGNGPRPTEAG